MTLARGDYELHEDFQARVARLLTELHGVEPENALCAIRQLPAEALAIVADGYRRESDGARRQAIVHALWESRNPAVLPTLGLALSDPDDRVWKEALDGIVTLGGAEARQMLERARHAIPHEPKSLAKRQWLDEAIKHVQTGTSPGELAAAPDGTGAHSRVPLARGAIVDARVSQVSGRTLAGRTWVDQVSNQERGCELPLC